MHVSGLKALRAAALMLTFLSESSAMIRHFYACEGKEQERFISQKIGAFQMNLGPSDKLFAEKRNGTSDELVANKWNGRVKMNGFHRLQRVCF